jgi:transcriptional regulator with XRE-family HTH domain
MSGMGPPEPPVEDYEAAKLLLGAEIRRRRTAAGWSQENLAARTGVDQSHISKAETGKVPASAPAVEKIDRALDAGGVLVRLSEQAAYVRHSRQAGQDGSATKEVSPSDRRDALRTLALGPAAAELSRLIAGADPDPLAVDQHEARISQIATLYRTTPHQRMVAAIGPQWREVEEILGTRVSPRVRRRLTLTAGYYALYLGTLYFQMGDDDTARGFLRLSHQHAAETTDLLPVNSPLHSDVTLLTGSVAAIRSQIAYFQGAYPHAVDIARAARVVPNTHPYLGPILAGCEAAAAARDGRVTEAGKALEDMQESVWDGGIMPGVPNPGDVEFAHGFLAGTLPYLGQGERAEDHARIGLELVTTSNPGHFVQIAGKHNSLCRSLLRRSKPDPERAATSAQEALRAVNGTGNVPVVLSAGQMAREMSARWPGLPVVRELGEAVHAARRALPSGRST